MKNWIQEGKNVTAVAPTGGVVAGTPVLIGALLLVPAITAAEGVEFEGVTCGVFELPKTSANTPTQFAKAYWNSTAGEATTTASGNTLMGVFMQAYANGDTVCHVRLDGKSV
jgi:predicted RecA/RadA family phage recombinase